MNLRINSCGINDCPTSWSWTTPKNGFPDYDIWAVFRGRGCIEPQSELGIKYDVYEGAALLLAPNTQYLARHDESNPLLVINVHFDFLDEDGKAIYPLPILAKNVSDVSFLKTLLTKVVSLFNSNQQELASVFLSAALSEYIISEELGEQTRADHWRTIVNEIASQIDSFSKAPSLFEFAQKYGYTERYIGRMFNEIKGVSFSEYLQNSRISKAKAMLKNTTEPIAKIAEEVGFYDPCHFSRVFRGLVGVSPLSFRKNK